MKTVLVCLILSCSTLIVGSVCGQDSRKMLVTIPQIDLVFPADSLRIQEPSIGSVLWPVVNPDKWPIFCKWEHRLQATSGTAFRFRLGRVDYCDYPE